MGVLRNIQAPERRITNGRFTCNSLRRHLTTDQVDGAYTRHSRTSRWREHDTACELKHGWGQASIELIRAHLRATWPVLVQASSIGNIHVWFLPVLWVADKK
ncbi:hypothetical protein ACJJTC_000914 [Scirpophaga incertulas]